MQTQVQTQIPPGWQKVKLEDVVNVSGGGTPSTQEKSYWNGNTPWLTPAEISNYDSRYIAGTASYITESGLNNSSAKIMPVDSLLLTSRATIGDVVINKVPMATNQGFINIEPKRIDKIFFYYWLKYRRKYLNQIAVGSTFPELTKSVFKKIETYFPEKIEVQNKIGKILSALDDKIELNNKIAKTLEQMAQAIFKEWFIKSEKLKVKSEKLEKIAKIIKGKKPQKIYNRSRGRDAEYLLIESFITNKRFFTNGDEAPQSDDGDIIIVMDGASSGRIFRGRKGVVGSTLAVIKPKPGISHEFLLLVLKRAESQLMSNLTGSAIPHLDKDFLKTYSVSVPTPEVMEKFTYIVGPMLQKMVKIENENQKLVALRDLLLPKLMKGEIRV